MAGFCMGCDQWLVRLCGKAPSCRIAASFIGHPSKRWHSIQASSSPHRSKVLESADLAVGDIMSGSTILVGGTSFAC